MNPEFLTVDDVLELHAMQLSRFGGAAGLRDRGLLESAVAQPQATFSGNLVHDDLFEQAAAYLFHLVCNHPFVDGNKRTGLLAALVFLELNGIVMEHNSQQLYDLTISVAEGRTSKAEVVGMLRRIAAHT
ncbi:MAG: death-on-curing protein [Deltaproteobacteria bacterium RIFOXYA12_FULL_61_11]|nr:MAG: death-on-curing protein [Deltaproteobacteria bacterium RIFOXYA12_FULL_61_11]